MVEFSVLLYAKQGQTEALADALATLVKCSQQEEGAQMYDLHSSDDGLFVITEKWADQQVLDAHEATTHFTEFQSMAENLVENVVRLPKTEL